MTTQEFVDAMRELVVDRLASEITGMLANPPGRRPSTEVAELSQWYNQLSPGDQASVKRLLGLAARYAVLGVFAALDGSAKIDRSWAPGDHFELRHVTQRGSELIAGRETALHELL